MWDEKEFEELEEYQHELTVAAFAVLLTMHHALYQDLVREFTLFYQKYGKDGVVTYQEARKWIDEKDHRKRLVVLYAFLDSAFEAKFNQYEESLHTILASIVKTETDFFKIDISTDKMLEIEWGLDESVWYKRLRNYKTKWTNTLKVDLKRRLVRKDSIEQVLEDLNKRFISMEKILWRLYQTESNAIGSHTRRSIFKELGVTKYKYYAREDERTCETCGTPHGLHGKVFPISAYEVGVTAPPIHAHCRCWTIPMMD